MKSHSSVLIGAPVVTKGGLPKESLTFGKGQVCVGVVKLGRSLNDAVILGRRDGIGTREV